MIEKKELLIAVGVTVGAAVLVLFMRKPAAGGASGGTGGEDIPGGFATASTVYVPTTSYNMSYNDYKGTVSYSTVDNTTTTKYGGDGGGLPVPHPPTNNGGVAGGLPIPHPPIHLPPAAPHPPIYTGGGGKINPPTKQTGTKPKAPAPKAPAPKQPTKEIGTVHYATPKGGWNPSSVVDYVKEHGGDASTQGRAKLAVANGITNYKGTAAQNQSLLTKLKSKYGNK